MADPFTLLDRIQQLGANLGISVWRKLFSHARYPWPVYIGMTAALTVSNIVLDHRRLRPAQPPPLPPQRQSETPRYTEVKMHPRLILLALIPCTLFADPPQARKPEIREVRATGCVRKTKTDCLLLTTLDGKTTYTFTAAPKPDAGTVITIQGKAHQGPATCKSGVPIDVIDWEPTGETCVE